jgi:hypothetical protein
MVQVTDCPTDRRDFFVSFNEADRAWATWVAWVLEEAGYSVFFQDWDFRGNFVEHINRSHARASRTVAVISDHYFGSNFALAEWSARFTQDPGAHEDRLVPIKVGQLTGRTILDPLVCADLTGCDEEEARRRLLGRVKKALDAGYRDKPLSQPRFPGSPIREVSDRPVFPPTGVEPGDLGPSKQVVAREEPESRGFSAPLRDHMAKFQRHIETLTQEQYRVIRQLGPNRRVRITGCTGSGKTLVAAEKAVRLGRAGLRTLLLCHNPLLAKHIAGLTRGAPVAVWAFGDWVRHLTLTPADTTVGLWTNYDEPEPAALEAAFDALAKSDQGFDAIIVDEGQDFRSDWWVLVEGALAAPESGILYIFHDDHQSLLPHRSSYPVAEPVLDLSRNCRNSGRVFNLVRYFHPQAPETELPLTTMGYVWLECVSVGQEIAGLRGVLKQTSTAWLARDNKMVVLLCGGLRVATWQHIGSVIQISTTETWQSVVLKYFERAVLVYEQRGVTVPRDALERVRAEIASLDREPLPTPADVETVRRIAGIFTVSRETRRRVLTHWQPRNYLRWRTRDQQLRLRRRDDTPLWAAEIVMHFEREDWPTGLPRPETFRLVPGRRDAKTNELSVFDLSAFKGLEADTIILVNGGYAPCAWRKSMSAFPARDSR